LAIMLGMSLYLFVKSITGGEIMANKNNKEIIKLRRIPERGEFFDLFKQVTDKIRRQKLSGSKAR
jgi:hypothetical protein